jgi:protein arginine kinase activator
MANPIKCSLCGKPATVHLTQIINNKIHKVDLCEDCAKAKGVTDPAGFSLADLLIKGALNNETTTEGEGGIVCPACGFTQQDFKKIGRFGCPKCYDAFRPMLTPMLGSMHKDTKHVGKVPQHAADRRSIYERLTKLEMELDLAIKTERYEDAARFRDEIRQIKQTAPGQ